MNYNLLAFRLAKLTETKERVPSYILKICESIQYRIVIYLDSLDKIEN
jgi:hypothetical protein